MPAFNYLGMDRYVGELVLWLLIVNLGIAFGAGIYEARLVVPQWSSALPHSLLRWNNESRFRPHAGARFWALISTTCLTSLAVLSLLLAQPAISVRDSLWLTAGAVSLVERALSMTLLNPLATRLERADLLHSSQATTLARQWIAMNHVRLALTLVAWLLALKALAVDF